MFNQISRQLVAPLQLAANHVLPWYRPSIQTPRRINQAVQWMTMPLTLAAHQYNFAVAVSESVSNLMFPGFKKAK